MQHLQHNSSSKQQSPAVPSSRHISTFTPAPEKKKKSENKKIKISAFLHKKILLFFLSLLRSSYTLCFNPVSYQLDHSGLAQSCF
jgi:hypothetical protein